MKNYIQTVLDKTEKYLQTDIRYLVKGGFWLGLGQATASLTSLILTIAFANLLPPETFGTYKFVLAMAALISIPTLPGINTALIRALAKKQNSATILAIRLKLTWGLTAFLAGTGVATYYFINDNYTLSAAFFIAAAFVPLMELGSLYSAILIGREDYKRHAIYHLVINLLVTTSLITLVLLTKDLLLILIAYFLTWSVCRLLALRRLYYQTEVNNQQTTTEVAPLGKHLSVIKVVNVIASQIDKVMLFHFLGPTSLAIYVIALAPIQNIQSIASVVKNLSLPRFSANSDIDPKLYVKKLLCFFFGLSLLTIVYILLAPWFLYLLFPTYPQAIFYTQLLAFGILGFGFMLNGSVLVAKNAVRPLYTQTLTTHLLQIVAIVVGVKFLGVLGAVLAFVGAQFFYFIISTIQTVHTLRKDRRS